jgi:hypothetical protein
MNLKQKSRGFPWLTLDGLQVGEGTLSRDPKLLGASTKAI